MIVDKSDVSHSEPGGRNGKHARPAAKTPAIRNREPLPSPQLRVAAPSGSLVTSTESADFEDGQLKLASDIALWAAEATSSPSTTAGTPEVAYAASKAGLSGLTRDLAHEWTGRRGIRVNDVASGYFASETSDGYEEALGELMTRVCSGRMGDPEELGAAIVFLASDASSYITGHTLVVDGGFTVS